jgi:cold shock CspA family protein
MQLMEIIVWFKDYADTTPGRERWSESQQSGSTQEGVGVPYAGTVINLNAKGFAFLKPDNGEPNIFIPPTIVHQYGLNEGAHIRAEIEEYVDNRSGDVRIRVRNIDDR